MKYQYIKEWDEFDEPEEENWDLGKSDFGYETKITIGKPTVKAKRSSVYKIVVNNMHGDADHYSKNTVYEKDIKMVRKIVEFVNWAAGARREQIYKKADELFGDDFYDMDIIDSDATTNGECLCRPNISKVTYFDENGTEFNVDININKGKNKK
jgi:hypothetical protein